MRILEFIHIGDIHYPESSVGVEDADIKDGAAPAKWRECFVPARLTESVSSALELLRQPDGNIAGVLVSGDLTSRADMDGYRACVEYLGDALQLGDKELWANRVFHVAPGNHDVDRTSDDRLHAASAAWDPVAHTELPVSQMRRTSVERDGCKALVMSVNSCEGCGDVRGVPDKIREALQTVLKPHLKEKIDAEAFDLIGERLDTPAIHTEMVKAVETAVQKLDQDAVPLVLGHHGLLAQARPRIDLYTEMLNGGHVRGRWASLARHVIYCHGHVHRDPIEEVRPWHDKRNAGHLLLISAPLMRDGFNLIRIHYSSRRAPLGCEVVPYRVGDHGGVRENDAIRIPFAVPGQLNAICHKRAAPVLNAIGGSWKRLSDIRKVLAGQFKPVPSVRTIAECLRELEWLGLVEIASRESTSESWTVRRVSLR